MHLRPDPEAAWRSVRFQFAALVHEHIALDIFASQQGNVALRPAAEPKHLVKGVTLFIFLRVKNSTVLLGGDCTLLFTCRFRPRLSCHDGPRQPVQILCVVAQPPEVRVDARFSTGKHPKEVFGFSFDEFERADRMKIFARESTLAAFAGGTQASRRVSIHDAAPDTVTDLRVIRS